MPCCWLFIVHASWGVYEARAFWSTYGLCFVEISLAGMLLYLARNHETWRGDLVFVVHYLFWILVIGERSGPIGVASVVFSAVFPCSGIAWIHAAENR